MVWLVYERSTGYIVNSIQADKKPSVMKQHDVLQADSVPDFNQFKVQAGKLVPSPWTGRPGYVDPLSSEDAILAAIDADRGRLQMTHLTRGTGVAQEYVKIQGEYADYIKLLPSVLTALSLTDTRKRFPTAMTEVALTGNTLLQVMSSYGTAIAANETYNRVIGRIAVNAKAKVKSATTLAAKKAVYTGINWNWTPGF